MQKTAGLILAVAAFTILVLYILEPASPSNLNWEKNTLSHRYHVQKRSPKILSKYVAAWSKKAKVLSVISPVPTSRLYFKAAHVFDKVLSKLLFKVPLVGRKRRSSEESLEIPLEIAESMSRARRSPKLKCLFLKISCLPTPRLLEAFRKKIVIVGRKKRSFWRR